MCAVSDQVTARGWRERDGEMATKVSIVHKLCDGIEKTKADL